MTGFLDQNAALQAGLDLERDVDRRPIGRAPTDPDTSDRSNDSRILPPFGYPDASDTSDTSSADALPRFPLDALPPLFQELAAHFAAATDVVPDLIVPAMLAALAASLGPTWKVAARSMVRSAILWFAVVASSGSAKTPSVAPILKPLHDLDRDLGHEHRCAMAEYQRRVRKANQRRHDDVDVPEKPVRRRAALTDLTPDGIVKSLANSPDGILAHSDELAQILSSFDAHSAPGRGRTIYLSLWSASRIAEGRKVADELEVDDPYAVLFGGIQPSRLNSLRLEDGDGLTARFLWSFPPFQVGGLGECLEPTVLTHWSSIIGRARALKVTGCVPELDADGVARLDALMRTWKATAHELDRRGHGLLASMYGKAADHCVRFLALLHGMDLLAEDRDLILPMPSVRAYVPGLTLERAVRLVEYYLQHGRAVVDLVLRPPQGDAPPPVSPKDLGVLHGLRALVARGEEMILSASVWADRLRENGIIRTAVELGRAFGRLQDVDTKPLIIEQTTRGDERGWRIWCPDDLSEVSEASETAIRSQDRASRPSVGSVGSVGPQSGASP